MFYEAEEIVPGSMAYKLRDGELHTSSTGTRPSLSILPLPIAARSKLPDVVGIASEILEIKKTVCN